MGFARAGFAAPSSNIARSNNIIPLSAVSLPLTFPTGVPGPSASLLPSSVQNNGKAQANEGVLDPQTARRLKQHELAALELKLRRGQLYIEQQSTRLQQGPALPPADSQRLLNSILQVNQQVQSGARHAAVLQAQLDAMDAAWGSGGTAQSLPQPISTLPSQPTATTQGNVGVGQLPRSALASLPGSVAELQLRHGRHLPSLTTEPGPFRATTAMLAAADTRANTAGVTQGTGSQEEPLVLD